MTLIMLLALAIVVTLFVVVRFVSSGKIPPEKGFRCSKCGNYAVHDERTIKAWRNEKHRFSARAATGPGWLKTMNIIGHLQRNPGPGAWCFLLYRS